MFDSSFEIKFSQLADARLQEMVPSLNQYKVGFQLIDKNEDDTKGVGVMAFLVNNIWVYVPAFFLSGKLKLPCLYIKSYDVRAPLNDSWISYIKSNELESLGALVNNDAVKVDNAKASLLNIIGKTASEKNELMSQDEVKRMFSAAPCPDTDMMQRFRDTGNKEAFIKLAEAMDADARMANAVFRYYGPEELRKTAEYLDNLPEDTRTEKAPVRVITKEASEATELSDDEKVRLFKEGSVIKDERDETSLVYKRDEKNDLGFRTPDVPGFYEVLMADGDTKKCIIAFPMKFGEGSYPAHHNRRRISSRCAVIFVDDPKKYFMITAKNVLARNVKPIEGSGVSGDNNITAGDDLSIKKLAEMDAKAVLLVDNYGNSYVLEFTKEWPKIKFTNRPGKLIHRNGVLLIPDNVLAFKQDNDYEDNMDNHVRLGDVNTFVSDLTKAAGLAPLKVYHDNSNGFYITSDKMDSKPLKKQAALECLVFNHGIKLEQAENMLKEASDHGALPKAVRYMVKYAGIYDLSTDIGTIPREVQTPTETETIIAPEHVTDLAVKASDTGLKEVLDTSVIASLIGTSRSLSRVGEFIPDLITAMDRLGSILCLYYWANEDFEEQYGRTEMVELEEKLIDVFNSLGDLTLFLKKKSTDSDSVFDGSKGNISEDMGEQE